MRHILLLAFAAVTLVAADATGKWTGTLTPMNSEGKSEPGPALLILKQEGSKLTGPAGPDESEQHPIQNGVAENGSLQFEVPTGDNIMKFTLKVEGDQINGDVQREREGQTQKARLAVKRAT